MSLKDLAESMKGRPELDAAGKDRAAERARAPFHEGWLREVYEPFWQAPLKKLSRAAGVVRVGHGIDTAPDVGVSFGSLALVIGEDVFVETVVGVVVKMSYIFAGDVNDGQLLRVPVVIDAGVRTIRSEHTKVWTGPINRLLTGAEEDVDDAAALFPTLLLEGVKAHDERLATEKAAADAAEADRVAAVEAAKKAEAEAKEQMETAALTESQRAEEAAKAAVPAAPPAKPEEDVGKLEDEEMPTEPSGRRRRK